MPERKTANEMTDKELMERAFSKRVVKKIREEIGADEEDESDQKNNGEPPQ